MFLCQFGRKRHRAAGQSFAASAAIEGIPMQQTLIFRLIAVGVVALFVHHAPAAYASNPLWQAAPSAASPTAFDGLWMGSTTGARPVDVVLGVETTNGKLSAQGALPAFGSLGESIIGIAEKDGHLTGSFSAMVGSIRFDVTRTGDALDGVLIATPPGSPQAIEMPVHLERTIEAVGAKDARTWAGQLQAGGQTLVMGLTIAPHGADRWAGAIDIPAQKIAGLSLFVTRSADGVFTVRLPVPGNATINLREDGADLRGEFSQATFKGPLVFRPHIAGTPLPAPGAPVRPQEPKAPFPYAILSQRVKHPLGHTLEGTLFLPDGASKARPVPGVLLVSGSGPQDRDEALMGHKPFLVLADALARRGIAVLRCDDRGVGGSTGSYATAVTDDFMSDAVLEFGTLANIEGIDAARLGIIGHSEGGLVAPMAVVNMDEQHATQPASAARPAFIVLMAGTGVNGDAILREQNKRILLATGLTEAQIAPAVAAHAAYLDAVKSGASAEVLRASAKKLVLAQIALGGTDPATIPAATLEVQVDAALAQVGSPWMKRFLVLDPAVSLRKVKCPVLVLNGTLDTQVDAVQNVPPIESALKVSGAPTTVKIMPGLNHLFQRAQTGAIDEYSKIEITIDPEVLDVIASWVLAQPPRPAVPPALSK
jgi:alpha-beta hydrolase superfamily lysophospholipase